jgi:hypothetical protein
MKLFPASLQRKPANISSLNFFCWKNAIRGWSGLFPPWFKSQPSGLQRCWESRTFFCSHFGWCVYSVALAVPRCLHLQRHSPVLLPTSCVMATGRHSYEKQVVQREGAINMSARCAGHPGEQSPRMSYTLVKFCGFLVPGISHSFPPRHLGRKSTKQ